jgi:flagellar protein FlgJ
VAVERVVSGAMGAAKDGAGEKLKKLERACKQFEGIFLSQLWKEMLASSRRIGGGERKRPFGPLEDTAVEMASEALSEAGGVGLWRVLYEQMKGAVKAEGDGDGRG